jgi:hypothetical protein
MLVHLASAKEVVVRHASDQQKTVTVKITMNKNFVNPSHGGFWWFPSG